MARHVKPFTLMLMLLDKDKNNGLVYMYTLISFI